VAITLEDKYRRLSGSIYKRGINGCNSMLLKKLKSLKNKDTKRKALELINKSDVNITTRLLIGNFLYQCTPVIKECALIAVDEMLILIDKLRLYIYYDYELVLE
jgi:hypothetical protein